MTPRAHTAALWGSVASTVLAVVLYYLLVWHTFRESWFYEGWVFLTHVAFAGIGFVLAIIEIRRRPVLCAVSAIVSGYLLLIQ